MKYLLILALTLNPLAYANRSIDVKTGDIVTKEFDNGVLMDKEKSNNIKNELIEKDGQDKLIQSYQKSINLYKNNNDLMTEKSDMLMKQNLELSKELNKARSLTTIEKVGLIILGVGITVGAGYAIRKAGN